MSAEGVKKFIAVVEIHFPRPQFDGDDVRQAAWFASISRTIGGYPDDVLSEAANHILRDRVPKRDGRFFPVPSECEDACKDALRIKRAKEMPLLSYAKADIPYGDRCRLASELMQSPLGKLARKEGWDVPMFHFCAENGRVPGGAELDDCRRSAKEFAALQRDLEAGEHPIRGPLSTLGKAIVAKAREIMEGSA